MQEEIKENKNMKVVKIEVIENNRRQKPQKYTFLGSECGRQAVELLATKFNISLVDFEEVKKE